VKPPSKAVVEIAKRLEATCLTELAPNVSVYMSKRRMKALVDYVLKQAQHPSREQREEEK
jgi:hypothetical protein